MDWRVGDGDAAVAPRLVNFNWLQRHRHGLLVVNRPFAHSLVHETSRNGESRDYWGTTKRNR